MKSASPPLSTWQRVQCDGWGEALEDAAHCVDDQKRRWYIHGGRTGSRRAGSASRGISGSLLCYDFESRGGVESQFKVPRPQLQVLYSIPDISQKDQQNTTRGISTYCKSEHATSSDRESAPVTASPPLGPVLYAHALFKHGPYVVTHGGIDRMAQVSSKLQAFHIDAGVWVELGGALGGCAPPRMNSHCVAPISRNDGTFLVVGTECDATGVGLASIAASTRKRSRSALSPQGNTEGRRIQGETSSTLAVFVLNLIDFHAGWRRVGLGSGARAPAARSNFSLNVARSSSASAVADGDGDNAAVAYLVGGKSGTTEYVDAWSLCLHTFVWRELRWEPSPVALCLRVTGGSASVASPYVAHVAMLCGGLRSIQTCADGITSGADTGGVVSDDGAGEEGDLPRVVGRVGGKKSSFCVILAPAYGVFAHFKKRVADAQVYCLREEEKEKGDVLVSCNPNQALCGSLRNTMCLIALEAPYDGWTQWLVAVDRTGKLRALPLPQ